MAGSSMETVGKGLRHNSDRGSRDRDAWKILQRLHQEFGVPVGILDPAQREWLATIGDESPSVFDVLPKAGICSDRSVCQSVLGGRWLRLSFPLPGNLADEPRYAVAVFLGDPAIWAERALTAWGESVFHRLATEWALRASSPPARASAVVERLIRRLRVSDAPERFQKRAATAVREAMAVQAVAWVPVSSREPVTCVGEIPGVNPESLRALADEGENTTLRVVNHDPRKPGLGRYAIASADLQGEAGWLLAVNPLDDRPFSVEPELLATVASLIATQRSNARIYGDLKELLFGVIRALTAAIDAKDRYTSGHSERVARIAVRIGQQLGMTPHEQGDLYLMGLLHDVGKIGVEDVVLKKAGKLTPDEYRQVQAHVRIGVHILSDLKKLQHLLPGVAFHHESLDGTGYPSGLKGDAIPLPARILAVADAFDAMSSSRPYRRRLSPAQIDEVFQKGSGVQWDPRIVQALIESRDDLDRIRQKGLGESLYQVINETLERN